MKYFNNGYFSNKYLHYGIDKGPIAKKLYKRGNLKFTIFEPRLIVCTNDHMLGYSADDVVFDEGNTTKLLEINV